MCNHNRLKENVKRAYGYRCQLCFKKFHKKELNAHHILQRKHGGLTIFENLKPLCFAECHAKVHEGPITHNSKGELLLIVPSSIAVPQLEIIEPPPLVLAA